MPEVWPYWVGQGYGLGTGGYMPLSNVQVVATTASTTAWDAWQAMPPTSSYNHAVWVNWQVQTTVTIGSGVGYVPATPLVLPEPESARHALIRHNRTRAHKLRQRIARRRAEALLLEHLDEAQREEWAKEKAFTVHTAHGKRAYRIAYGLAGNVRLVEAAEPPLRRGAPVRPGARFCMHVYHPDGAVPLEDNVLAQKLLIESNEAHFLELANVS